MSTTTVNFAAPPALLEEILLDATLYPRWIVGTENCDAVHPPWPAPGGAFTYSLKMGPFRFRDRTTMLEHDRGRQVLLEVAVKPFGEAHVLLRYEPFASGTRLTMVEHPVSGPARVLWNPLLDRIMHRRNIASLERLREIVETRADPLSSTG